MKDDIEGASDCESNLVAADRREVSVKEEANENESRRGVRQMRQQVPEAVSQHQFQHQHHHPHHHRQHAPTCLVSKLANNNELSPRTVVKHHQPHCIHHNPTNSEHQFAKGVHPNEDSPSDATMLDSKGQGVKYLKQQDKSYLLVEYRPSSSDARLAGPSNLAFKQQRDLRAFGRRRQAIHLHEASRGNSGSGGGGDGHNNKRTTIKFISQLYFLLHLSVILSLLMHHKNLVSNERDLMNAPQVSSSGK